MVTDIPRDLFGDPIAPHLLPDYEAITPETMKAKKRRRAPQAKGYYRLPGTGPKGETCGSCKHKVAHRTRASAAHGKTFWKCGRVKWAHSTQSDIRVGWAACEGWERPDA